MPHYIIMIRHPFEVAASLSKRDGFSQKKGLILWQNYSFSSYLTTQNDSRIIVNFSDLLTNPIAISKKIAEQFLLELSETDNNTFFDSSLKRQCAEDNTKQEHNFLQTLSIELFTAICPDKTETVAHLYAQYQTHLNTVLIEHLTGVQKSEIHFKTIIERAYNSYTWKLFRPIKKTEEIINNKFRL